MGKVYEALLRAESEDAERGLADDADDVEAIDVEDERAIRNPRGINHTALDDDPRFGHDIEAAVERGLAREGDAGLGRGLPRGGGSGPQPRTAPRRGRAGLRFPAYLPR